MISSFLLKAGGEAASRLPSWLRERSMSRREEFERQVERLVRQPELRVLYIAEEMRLWLSCVLTMLLIIFGAIVKISIPEAPTSVILLVKIVVSCLALVVGMLGSRAMSVQESLRQAQTRILRGPYLSERHEP